MRTIDGVEPKIGDKLYLITIGKQDCGVDVTLQIATVVELRKDDVIAFIETSGMVFPYSDVEIDKMPTEPDIWYSSFAAAKTRAMSVLDNFIKREEENLTQMRLQREWLGNYEGEENV